MTTFTFLYFTMDACGVGHHPIQFLLQLSIWREHLHFYDPLITLLINQKFSPLCKTGRYIKVDTTFNINRLSPVM